MSVTRASAAHAHDSGEAAVVSTTGQDVEEREERSAEEVTPEAEEVVPEAEEITPEEEAPSGGTGRFARWRRVLAGALAVLLVAAGAALFVRGQQIRDTPANANRALTDTAGTDRVTADVSSALTTVFSYAPGTTAATKTAAQRLLAGAALKQYAALFGQVEKQAADQKLTLTTHVVRVGVVRLTGDSAHLLVFMDQVYEREGKAATSAPAQLSVTAHQRDDVWQIVDITSR
ncbi:hypothetical protein [Streptomyces sp. NBC_00102]|uniref:hypothetical protein n=1 Tax=Streptomyces sp. NBC_00102 TaxID=2975652 RepID=UPI0022583A75|nr:hypothetical protein [Streptomyces sp. NBC_00102]MCX5401035.1 hypothetical protein [Streptomyces sp. NBC_00102]